MLAMSALDRIRTVGPALTALALLAASGIGGLFQVDAIGAETISGVISGLSEPGLPSGDVPFEAVRCPGEWKLP